MQDQQQPRIFNVITAHYVLQMAELNDKNNVFMIIETNQVIYNGEISAGSLLVGESRLIARLLLDKVDGQDWDRVIQVDNILQKRNPASAKRQARLIRKRLGLMAPDLWYIVVDGSMDAPVQALLAAAIKHSRLLGDHLGLYRIELQVTAGTGKLSIS